MQMKQRNNRNAVDLCYYQRIVSSKKAEMKAKNLSTPWSDHGQSGWSGSLALVHGNNLMLTRYSATYSSYNQLSTQENCHQCVNSPFGECW